MPLSPIPPGGLRPIGQPQCLEENSEDSEVKNSNSAVVSNGGEIDDDEEREQQPRRNPCTMLRDGIAAFVQGMQNHPNATRMAVITAPALLTALNRHVLHTGDPAYALDTPCDPECHLLPGSSNAIVLDSALNLNIAFMTFMGIAAEQAPAHADDVPTPILLRRLGQYFMTTAFAISAGTASGRGETAMLVILFWPTVVAEQLARGCLYLASKDN